MKLRTALQRFRYDAQELLWPSLPEIHPPLIRALTDIAVWTTKRGEAKPDHKGLRGLFIDPVTVAAPPPAPPPMPDDAVIAVMSKLGTKGGASKSDRKIAAAKATISKVNAARALKRAKG
jgi:hypothetical protein